MMKGGPQRSWVQLLPLLFLCLLNASRWLIENAVPAAAPTLASETLGTFVAALSIMLMLRLAPRGPQTRASPQPSLGRAAMGGLVVVAPALCLQIAGQHISPNHTTLALALCPVVTAVAVVAASATEASLTELIWPGLAGVMALLLLVPEPTFAGARGWTGLCLMPVMVGVAAGIFSPPLRPDTRIDLSGAGQTTAAALLLAAACFALLTAVSFVRSGSWTWPAVPAIVLDGLTAALTLWTLQRLGAVRWCMQFLLVPLLGLLEGVVLLRPPLTWRTICPVLLLGVGAAYQWRAGRDGAFRAMDRTGFAVD